MRSLGPANRGDEPCRRSWRRLRRLTGRLQICLLEIFAAALRVGLDRAAALLPVGRADLAVLFEELQGVDHAQGFVDAAAERQVVDHLMADDAFLVDQEQAARAMPPSVRTP